MAACAAHCSRPPPCADGRSPAAHQPQPGRTRTLPRTPARSIQLRAARIASARPVAAAAAAAAGPPPAASSPAAGAFDSLAAEHLDTCHVAVQPCRDPTQSDSAPARKGNGLFAIAAAAEGEVLLRIPLDRCVVVDYRAGGLRIAHGQWPRLQRGVQKDGALPWDVLQALALLDALAGGGDDGGFWARYADAVLPQPLALSLPLCLPEELLPQLGHAAIIEAARAQKQRLARLFPGLAPPIVEGGPSFLEWAFACVRSRAFELRAECFAFVPFLDVANHEDDPSCDFRLAADGASVELVAVRGLAAGQEATISYTGPAGMTNQRLMAQYGFVPRCGNRADRLQFAALAAAAAGAADGSGSEGESSAGSGGGNGSPPALLSLDRMQVALGGGEAMAWALSGQDPYAFAALKSLPFAAEEHGAATLPAQLALAERLAAELEAEGAGWPAGEQQLAAQQQGGSGDPRIAAAQAYQSERQALVQAALLLLRGFLVGSPQPGGYTDRYEQLKAAGAGQQA